VHPSPGLKKTIKKIPVRYLLGQYGTALGEPLRKINWKNRLKGSEWWIPHRFKLSKYGVARVNIGGNKRARFIKLETKVVATSGRKIKENW
jgi:hypothetical protein